MKQHKNAEKLAFAREHAFAILIDQGQIYATAQRDRIKTATLVAMLGVTFVGGKPITKGCENAALLHWFGTGFRTYDPPVKRESKKQKAASDMQLMKTATAETMRNRRQQFYSPLKPKWVPA